MVSKALKAAETLGKYGIKASVLDMHTLKPLDENSILKAADKTGGIVTIEDHNIINGLGSAVAEVLSENYPVPLKRMGIPDTYAESGAYLDLLDKYNLGVNTIVDEAIQLIGKKR